MPKINAGNSTKSAGRSKPNKPYPDFPLTAHPNGQWSKKIKKQVWYFGPWDDWKAARRRYLDERDDLLAGRLPKSRQEATTTPAHEPKALTLHGLANHFIAAKDRRRKGGELTHRSFLDYHRTCERLLKFFGRELVVATLATDAGASHFERLRENLSETLSLVSLSNEITRIRVVFKYAYKQRLIKAPVWYGESFEKPTAKTLDIERGKRGPRMFTAHEIRSILNAAPEQLRVMTLLAINTGCGNHDVGALEFRHLDLAGRWLNFPRPKNGTPRRCWLWEETVEALEATIKARSNVTAKREADGNLVFLTRCRESWYNEGTASPLSVEFKKLLVKLGIYRKGVNFYSLRHSFATVGSEARDQVALNSAMGHRDGSVSGMYREYVSDHRLRAVAETVHEWLWPRPRVLKEWEVRR